MPKRLELFHGDFFLRNEFFSEGFKRNLTCGYDMFPKKKKAWLTKKKAVCWSLLGKNKH